MGAQSSPGWSYGFVPTPAQWNRAFSEKQDALGFTPVNRSGDVMTGTLTLKASSVFGPSLTITPGVSPAGDAKADGDLWMTSDGLFYQINGESVGPIGVAQTFKAMLTALWASLPTSPPLTPGLPWRNGDTLSFS
jgi:hypothetical protein